MTAWNVSGRYYETCSCDFVCPCLLGRMAVAPTKGSCTFAMAFRSSAVRSTASRSMASASSCWR